MQLVDQKACQWLGEMSGRFSTAKLHVVSGHDSRLWAVDVWWAECGSWKRKVTCLQTLQTPKYKARPYCSLNRA